MDFVKRNLFFILCGLGGAAGIALMVTGMQAMPKVAAAMGEAKTVYDDLGSLKPANQKSIDAENKRIQSLLDDRKQVLEKVAQLAKYQPLLDGVLPNGPDSRRVEFRKVYVEEVHKLLDSLNWGRPPTAADVERARDQIAEDKASGKQPSDNDPKHNLILEPGPRAAISKAQTILLYAIPPEEDKPPEHPASLLLAQGLRDTGTVEAPALEDTWRAQVWFWIQRDVVEAVKSLNTEAAEAAQKEGQRPWVGNMPVKDIVSVRISDYVPPKGDLYAAPPAGGNNPATPQGTAESVFTGTTPAETYDVVQFAVKLVMDQRDIPRLVERLCNNSLHTLLYTAYKYNPPSKNLSEKIWGPEPTVNVVLEFETVMLGEQFRKWMPKDVCEKNGIKCPEHKAGENEGG